MAFGRRGREEATPTPAPDIRPAPTAPVGGWRDLPPVQRTIGRPTFITDRSRFEPALQSWHSPGFVGSLGHAIDPAGPSGSISVDPVPAAPTHTAPPVGPRPLVQRAITAVQRAVRRGAAANPGGRPTSPPITTEVSPIEPSPAFDPGDHGDAPAALPLPVDVGSIPDAEPTPLQPSIAPDLALPAPAPITQRGTAAQAAAAPASVAAPMLPVARSVAPPSPLKPPSPPMSPSAPTPGGRAEPGLKPPVAGPLPGSLVVAAPVAQEMRELPAFPVPDSPPVVQRQSEASETAPAQPTLGSTVDAAAPPPVTPPQPRRLGVGAPREIAVPGVPPLPPPVQRSSAEPAPEPAPAQPAAPPVAEPGTDLTSPLLGDVDASPVQRSVEPPPPAPVEGVDGVNVVTVDPAPEPDLPVATPPIPGVPAIPGAPPPPVSPLPSLALPPAPALPPPPVAPLLGARDDRRERPAVAPVAPAATSAPTPTTPISRSVAPPPSTTKAPLPPSTTQAPAPAASAPSAPVQRVPSDPSAIPSSAPRRTGMPSDSIPADTRAAMIAAAFAGGAPPTVMRVPATVMRVPASQAPTDLPFDGNGAAAPQPGEPVFAPVPVSRVSEEQASSVPASGGGDAAFSAGTSSPPPAAADGTPAPDTDRLVAQLVGPLYERIRGELRRERIRRGSVHDRLG